tara:strand:- start:2473 stop:3546 length:1074 start_codon:yes stop_codon:yes gene_type:complete
MATKNKLSKDKIIVIGISVVAVALIIGYMVKILSGGSSKVKVTDDVIVSDTGEASSINFTVPTTSNGSTDDGGILSSYEKRKRDSLNALRNGKEINLKDIHESKGEIPSFNDKLYSKQDDEFLQNVERQLQEMEANGNTGNASVSSGGSSASDKMREEMEYRQMLLDAREQRTQRSQDYSGGANRNGRKGSYNDRELPDIEEVEFRVAVYHDQLILPGERVTLILTEELEYGGNIFPKNTIIYAMASVNKNRVLLDVANINHVMVNLVALDVDDGMKGLYNTKAGALWDKYEKEMSSDVKSDLLTDASRSVPGGFSRVAGSLARSMGSFFRKKSISNRDKILLVNDDQLILTTQQDG